MLSNMIANLTDLHAMDKFDAALVEIPKVRADLGYPPLVTPMSQMVGTQAVMNCIVGPYKAVSKEVKAYFRGEYGNPPAPVNAELSKQILGNEEPTDCRIADAAPSTMFEDAAAKLGDLAQSEEDVMSYICFPNQAEEFLKKRKAKADGTWVEPQAEPTAAAAPAVQVLGNPNAAVPEAPQVSGNAITYTVSCEEI
jgi:oxaloacetate decarboxylase alpha subunit